MPEVTSSPRRGALGIIPSRLSFDERDMTTLYETASEKAFSFNHGLLSIIVLEREKKDN